MPNGQWANSQRAQTLPRGWQRIRRHVLERDNHACYKCGSYANIVDHVTNAAAGGTDAYTNLAAICDDCHRRKSSAEGGRAAQAARPKRRRPQEPHPGLR